MKKSLLALAALTAFAGAASAQSSVTMYGRVDLSVGRNIGSDAKFMANGSGSRLGMRGSEDLGGGMSAIFNIEHRFDADTGASQNFNVCGLRPNGSQSNNTTTTVVGGAGGTVSVAGACNNNRFWGARSFVGLQGGFGSVVLGREYTTSFLGNQLIADPWGWDTVANQAGITGLGGIAKVRNDSSLTYKVAFGGFGLGAQVAEATDAINQFDSKPYNFSLGYNAGPVSIGAGYEHTGRATLGGDDEDMWGVNAAFKFGAFKPGLFYGEGNALSGAKHKGAMATVTMALGSGELRASYGRLKAGNTTVSKRAALGYHYSMSKRTTLYADVAHEGEAASNKAGFDLGIKHNF
ncbi:MAG: porin [Rubrivivax sp.]